MNRSNKSANAERLLTLTIHSLCEDLPGIKIKCLRTEGALSFVIVPSAANYGRILGANGRNLTALSAIVNEAAKRSGAGGAHLVLERDTEGPESRGKPFIPKEGWVPEDNESLIALLREWYAIEGLNPSIKADNISRTSTVFSVISAEDSKLQPYIGVLFAAVAKAKGRNAFLDFVRRNTMV